VAGLTMRLFTVPVLVLLCGPAAAEQFSVKCTREFFYFLTFDTAENRVVYEVVMGGSCKGRITHASATRSHSSCSRSGSHRVA
jgi:hypothetical protein